MMIWSFMLFFSGSIISLNSKNCVFQIGDDRKKLMYVRRTLQPSKNIINGMQFFHNDVEKFIPPKELWLKAKLARQTHNEKI